MASIQFHLRPSSLGREYEGSLFIRVIHQRKALNITTPYHLYPSEWNEKHHCIVYHPEGAARFLYLSKVEKMMAVEKEALLSIMESWELEGEYTVTDVVNLYRIRKSGVPMLPFVEKLVEKLNAEGKYRTARAYQTASRGLTRFTGKERFPLTDIRPSLIKEFQDELIGKGRSMNTVSFYMRNLRAIHNHAIRERLIETPRYNPFERVYTGVEQTRKRALNKEEIALISSDLFSSNKKGENKEKLKILSITQRLFLFSFHARGMSFVDVSFLKKTDIQGKTLTYRRRKTGQLLEMNVTREMRQIINSFANDTKYSPYVFPIIHTPGKDEYRQYETALKVQNKRLKQLAKFYNLPPSNFQLSTHVARHTWASLAKELNYPLAVISEGLGHTSEKTTSIYLASFDRAVLDNMNKRISKEVKKNKNELRKELEKVI